MLIEKLTIPMHSFVDLITNSSTEIYIQASEKTIESIKALVNNILKLGNSDVTCDDLFTIELGEAEESYEGYKSASLIVKNRDENSELGKKTAAVLANLTGMFSIDAAYNG
jgi:hypothetical protein